MSSKNKSHPATTLREFHPPRGSGRQARCRIASLEPANAAPSDGYFGRPISARHTLVDRMLELIHLGFAEMVTLPALGASIGREPAYLGGLFHRTLGLTVRDYVTRLRLMHAAELIRDGVKIEAVALLVGYRSKKNFYWRFRQHFGTTPGAYRCHGDAPPARRAYVS
jgi:transcriptional regulator GlxA family with amidase domain